MIRMHRTPYEQLQEILSLSESVNEIDMQDAIRRKKQMAQEFRDSVDHKFSKKGVGSG